MLVRALRHRSPGPRRIDVTTTSGAPTSRFPESPRHPSQASPARFRGCPFPGSRRSPAWPLRASLRYPGSPLPRSSRVLGSPVPGSRRVLGWPLLGLRPCLGWPLLGSLRVLGSPVLGLPLSQGWPLLGSHLSPGWPLLGSLPFPGWPLLGLRLSPGWRLLGSHPFPGSLGRWAARLLRSPGSPGILPGPLPGRSGAKPRRRTTTRSGLGRWTRAGPGMSPRPRRGELPISVLRGPARTRPGRWIRDGRIPRPGRRPSTLGGARRGARIGRTCRKSARKQWTCGEWTWARPGRVSLGPGVCRSRPRSAPRRSTRAGSGRVCRVSRARRAIRSRRLPAVLRGRPRRLRLRVLPGPVRRPQALLGPGYRPRALPGPGCRPRALLGVGCRLRVLRGPGCRSQVCPRVGYRSRTPGWRRSRWLCPNLRRKSRVGLAGCFR